MASIPGSRERQVTREPQRSRMKPSKSPKQSKQSFSTLPVGADPASTSPLDSQSLEQRRSPGRGRCLVSVGAWGRRHFAGIGIWNWSVIPREFVLRRTAGFRRGGMAAGRLAIGRTVACFRHRIEIPLRPDQTTRHRHNRDGLRNDQPAGRRLESATRWCPSAPRPNPAHG